MEIKWEGLTLALLGAVVAIGMRDAVLSPGLAFEAVRIPGPLPGLIATIGGLIYAFAPALRGEADEEG